MKNVLAWAVMVGLVAASVPLMKGIIHAQGSNCFWRCDAFGNPYWFCDERYGPYRPPSSPPPRCR